jgi:hypothetical protein
MSEAELVNRLELLERQNRRLRWVGATTLCVVVALVLMGVARPVAEVVTAEKFSLVDANGQERAKLELVNNRPQLDLSDSQGIATLGVGAIGQGPSLMLIGADGQTSAELVVRNSNPSLNLTDAAGNLAVWMTVQNSKPLISLADASGYDTDIGSTELLTPTTGEKQQTSAASIVMFGSNKHVIWKAPQ